MQKTQAESETTHKSVEAEDLAHDYHGWLLSQASALRGRRFSAVDWDNLAEELEAMAAADLRELLRRLTSLFEHLLNLAYQPQELPRRGNGWRRTVVNSRMALSSECWFEGTAA